MSIGGVLYNAIIRIALIAPQCCFTKKPRALSARFLLQLKLQRSVFRHVATVVSLGLSGAEVMMTIEGASPRVLEVDDDRDVADSCAALLRCLGADVRVAYNGATALAIIPEFQPHLALIDIGMPEMDGCETARRIRMLAEGKDLILAALTAWSHAEVGHRVRAAGFDHHLVKPFPVEDFKQLLGSLCVPA